ncbi:MAG: class I SAM-dependent methyltransferase [Pseudomonadales bacterium]
MATHQQIAGVSDEELVERMLRSHDDRFNEVFWQLFDTHVGGHLKEDARIVDLGCGPGLLLRDLAERRPQAELFGYDITPAMVNYANNLGLKATFAELELVKEPIPLEEGSVDLVTMAAVLHVLDEPLKMLAELRRVLKSDGTFLLIDWVRQPLRKYLEMMMENVPPERFEQMEQAMLRLSVAHNKYTVDDWIWLLGKGGFTVSHHDQTRSEHFRTFVCRLG